jgi:hypothetical protein
MSITKKSAGTKTAKKTISKKSTTIKNEDILSNLKSDILSEVAPVLNKLSLPKIKKEVAKEFNSVLELEFEKLKSEFDNKHKKSSLKFSNVLNDFETKLMSSLNNNSSLKKQFSSFKENTISDLENNLEGLLSKKLSGVIESTIALHKKTDLEIKGLKDSFSKLVKDTKNKQIETAVESREDERKQAQFIVNKVNEVVDKVNRFEDDFNEGQKKILGNFELNIDNQFEQVEKRVRQELLHRVEIELQANHQDFSKQEKDFENNLKKFKVDLSTHVKEYISSLDKELKSLSNRESELSLKEKDFMQKVKVQIGMDVSVLENKVKDFRKEMDDLLKKLDSKKERKIFNDEIKSTLAKTKSEIESELDKQLHKNNEELTRVSLVAKESVKNLTNEVEDKLFNQIEGFKNSFDKELLTFSKELETRDSKLEKEISTLAMDREGLANERSSFNEKFSRLFLESKSQIKEAILSVKESNKDLKGTFTEMLTKKLSDQVEKFNKKYESNISKFEKKVSTFEGKFEKSLSSVASERDLLANDRKTFEAKFEKAVEETQEKINLVFSKFEIENKDLESALTNIVTAKLNLQVEDFEAKFKSHVNVFDEKLKVQENLLAEKIESISKERELLMKERVEVHDKVLEVLENSKRDIAEDLNKSNEIFDSLRSDVEESLARQIAMSSDQLSKIKDESYQFRDSIKSDIEDKLVYSNNKNDEEFKLHLEKFKNELKTKEEEFLKKLLALEEEKNSAILGLSGFKTELATHTKEYIDSLDKQLEKIKVEGKNLEEEKNVFVGVLEDTTNARKLDIESFGNEIRDSIASVISLQKETFEKNENSFRNIFSDKISNLENFQKKKLESIEKKFVDKNLKFVEDRVEQSIDMLKLIEDSLSAKVLTIDKKVDEVNAKEDDLAENVGLFENRVNERIETRLMSAEQSFNSRFLKIEEKASQRVSDLSQREREFVEDCSSLETEINERVEGRMMALEQSFNERILKIEEQNREKVDALASRENELMTDFQNLEIELRESSEERVIGLEQSMNRRMLGINEEFTNFKGIVVDEVEDLMKEVKVLMSEKVNQVDVHINKINFAGSEVVKRIKDFDIMKNSLEKEITFVRDDINDLRVKQDVLPKTSSNSTELVNYMSDYEQNLAHLVNSLKHRGISNDAILQTLAQKGHPMYYVKMVINELK